FDCKLCTSKSVRIIEDCLLAYLTGSILTEAAIRDFCQRANQILAEISSKPKANTAPLRAAVKRFQAQIKRLVDRITKRKENDALCDVYEKQIEELQGQIAKKLGEIREKEAQSPKNVKPLDPDRVK